ncbi:MAG: PIG-L family deacetylase [Saprospiraceae bacterium]|nr:PIG-L family deacetylase [Saprospiraceae bacterium]MDZ4704971.1 PIG-L family deacetylase [Saprospiraceae bacterium]
MQGFLHRRWSAAIALIFLALAGYAQKPKTWSSTDLYEGIQKLNFLGSVLYLAAHPDDENTRLIAYLANEVKANTAYLSLTRGDGGQNLVGPEIEELLGVIRTQELLAARRIDGGRQFFTRANDFGYSKHPDETLRLWNRDDVLSDVVWIIRKWQPDVIINRFDHNSAGKTHGHHTASAMLGVEAFDLAGKKDVYPDQLKFVAPWQPRRLFFNTSWWFYGSREKFAEADKSKLLGVDGGVFYTMRGKSNNEVAAESRSQHRSQGFGSVGTRGSELEYLELLKGDLPENKEQLFDGINTTWSRVEGGEPIGKLLKKVEAEYRFDNPAASVPKLLEALRLIEALPDGYWKNSKLSEIKEIIRGCLGLFMEAIAEDYSATPGQDVTVNVEIINRSNVEVTLQKLAFLPLQKDTAMQQPLAQNEALKFSKKLQLPQTMPFSSAYWLNQPWALGMYTVPDQTLRGLPETPRQFKVKYTLLVAGKIIEWESDIAFKREDPVKGEIYRPFEVTPPVFGNIAESAYVFADNEAQTVALVVKSGAPNVSGTASLDVPKGWRIEPSEAAFSLKIKGEEQILRFKLFPPKTADEGYIRPLLKVSGQSYSKEIVLIEYDHIPTQTILREGLIKVAKTDLKKVGERIAYIVGAGDGIPASLRQIGYDVTVLEDKDMTPENLARFDAVILGVRAYNTAERLKFHQAKLLEYVQNGGTMIVQYNTNFDMVLPVESISPYKLKISRDRVTLEEAEVRFLKPDHVLLNYPNKITAKDFEGWVQERGLYFPNEWGPEFEAILSCNDPGEPARDGGLLVAKYGKGHYIYTGYSWFRELPSGVPGAFRLFANMISIGKNEKR